MAALPIGPRLEISALPAREGGISICISDGWLDPKVCRNELLLAVQRGAYRWVSVFAALVTKAIHQTRTGRSNELLRHVGESHGNKVKPAKGEGERDS